MECIDKMYNEPQPNILGRILGTTFLSFFIYLCFFNDIPDYDIYSLSFIVYAKLFLVASGKTVMIYFVLAIVFWLIGCLRDKLKRKSLSN